MADNAETITQVLGNDTIKIVLENGATFKKVIENLDTIEGVLANLEAHNSLTDFFTKMKVQPGDWVVATKGSNMRSSTKYSTGDVGKLTGIHFKDNGKFAWKVKWYHTNKETDERCNGQERVVNVTADFTKLEGKAAESLENAKKGLEVAEKNAFTVGESDDMKKYKDSIWKAAKRLKSTATRRRRLSSMERLLNEIKRAQRTA